MVFYGSLTVYNGTPETSSGYLVSLNGKSSLAVPTVSATPNPSNKTIAVSWTAVEGATSYDVTCGTQTQTGLTGTSYTFTMADYGTYAVTVKAISATAYPAICSSTVVLSDPSITTKDYYKLVTSIEDITEGTYVVGALRSSSASDNFYFGKASVSSGDWEVSDSYVTVTSSNGVRKFEAAILPTGAVEFTFTGNNTNGFTICNGSDYLYYTAASNRKLAFAANGSSQKWIVAADDSPLVAGGIYLKAVTSSGNYTISENSTSTGAIRGYASTTSYRAIYLFKKVNE